MQILTRPDLLLPLALFVTVTAYTPGPNNSILMASGLNWGFKRTVPTIIGAWLGFNILILCIGLGLGIVFQTYPLIYTLLKYGGAAYMLYMAWMLARSGGANAAAPRARPFTFTESAALQVLNPKGWVMGVGAVSAYAGIAPYPMDAFIIAGTFAFIGVGSTLVWTGAGAFLQKIMHKPRLLRAFNLAMALLLAASILPIFFE